MRKAILVVTLLASVCLFGTLCTSHSPALHDAYGRAFAGDAACKSCHTEICRGQSMTAHYHDSRAATGETIKGSFETRMNRFFYNDSEEVSMGHGDSGWFQTAYRNGVRYRSERFGMVIGSGKKGQSYLYWKGTKLFQLPVSYSTSTNGWCKSPGYTADTPFFDRRVPAQCLECHTTNARTVSGDAGQYGDFFDKSQLVYGIGCEKCHGPGADHIKYHTENPGEKVGLYILNARRMTRQQRLDACAQCHSGSRVPLRPVLSFRVGDKLDDYSEAKYSPEDVANLDVHGNQYGLLTSSKCFRQSEMDCSSCHNVHVQEAGDLKTFSRRCMNCHNGAIHKSCSMPVTTGLVLGDNCIDCHMPALLSRKIVLRLSNAADTARDVPTPVRTHHIAIYPEYTRIYLSKLKPRRS